MQDSVVAKLDLARTALAEAKTIQETKTVLDMAVAAEVYAKRQKLGEEAERYAIAIKIEALAQLGNMLRDMPKNKGAAGGGIKESSRGIFLEPRDTTPTLADLGLDKKTSKLAQDIAKLPEEQIEKVKAGVVSISSATNKQRREQMKERYDDVEFQTDKKYRVIYADPPWMYDKGKELSDKYGDVSKHYPPMETEDICILPVQELAEDDCVLFLWATAPKLPEALQVMQAWGFDYKTCIVWDKIKHNFGYYFSVRHELLLIGGRGSSTPDNSELHDSVISIERSDRHSEKPQYFRDLILKMYRGKKIELFAREKPEGFDVWGNDESLG
jgi:N6-adenosine-specific RNA methylase IME4